MTLGHNSSGSRNSRDSVSAQIAEEAMQRYEQRRRSFLDAQMQEAGVTSTIKESPSSSASEQDSANLNTDPSEDVLQEKEARPSGLSQYSPFASSGLTNAPSF